MLTARLRVVLLYSIVTPLLLVYAMLAGLMYARWFIDAEFTKDWRDPVGMGARIRRRLAARRPL